MEQARHKTANRPPAAPVKVRAPSGVVLPKPISAAVARIQTQSLKVSSPRDPAEREADATARKVTRMVIPEGAILHLPSPSGGVFRQVQCDGAAVRGVSLQRTAEPPSIARFSEAVALMRHGGRAGTVQRKAPEGQPNVAANVGAELTASLSSGAPLPLSIRRFMEPRFAANFSAVRIHTDNRAAKLNQQFSAQAFTVGQHIFFCRDRFQPESGEGRELIAHELTHTIQQGAVAPQPERRAGSTALQRREDVTIAEQAPVQVQRLGLSDALDYFADKANLIPGFRMFTIILGLNPINMSRVDRSAANILRALIEFIPGGNLIVRALDNHGVFERAGAWIEEQIRTLGLTGASIRQAISDFIDSLSWRDIFDLGGVWDRAKRIFTEPIDRIIGLARSVGGAILQMIKDAILRPLANLASQTRAWDLLCAVLGRNPITGDAVPRTADTLIGGFMKLIGQEEVWENLKRANAVARAWAWFQGALASLLSFVSQIPALFIAALRSLEIADIILLPQAFIKVGRVFADFVVRFISWAGQQVLSLLQIIFEVLAPAVMPYIRKAAGALQTIIRNPIGFVGNLVRAAKRGFEQFAKSFLEHLKKSLIDWLTGSMPSVYIPKSFSLGEIVRFVFSVLGLSWQIVRQGLVKIVSEPVVAAMETGFDIVVTLVRDGPAAAWEKIKEQLTNLKDLAINAITDLIVDMATKKAIPKLLAMFIPGAGFLSAILSIYDTIMVFVSKIAQIAQVVANFIDSLAAIANGDTSGAAKRVESTLAGLMTLAINFLAGFAGFGKVADKVMGALDKYVRAPIAKARDALISWIVTMAKKLFAKVFGKKDGGVTPEDGKAGAGVKAKVAAELTGKKVNSVDEEKSLILSVYNRFKPEGLKSIAFQPSDSSVDKIDVIVSASLAERVSQIDMTTPEGIDELRKIAGRMSMYAERTTIYVFYDSDRKQFDGPISQRRGQAGHAEHQLKGRFPDLMARLKRTRTTLKTPLSQPVPVRLDINRTPCDGCATSHIMEIIDDARGKYSDVPIAISISSASISKKAQITTEKGLIALMKKGVHMTSSTVWSQIRNQMLSAGIKQLEYGTKTFDIDDVNELIAEAKEVQDLIDKAVAEMKRNQPASVKQG
jgi:Domain of unknown function (DUF4157)